MPRKRTTATKPASKPQPRRQPATPKPEVVAPVPSALFDPPAPPAPAAAPAVEIAASGEASAQVSQPAIEAASQEAAVVEVIAEAPAPAPILETSDEFTTVRMGVVSAALLRMPLSEVLIHMDTFMSRLAAVAETKGSLDLQAQMLATEGRCAPVYFTGDPEDGELEHFFDGADALAAAVSLGLDTVSVIVIAPGDAGAAQNHLQAHRLSMVPKDPDESFLRAVMAYQEVPPASPA